MNLRERAEADMTKFVTNDVTGFGYPITLTDPAQLSKPLKGYSNDIAFLIDPDTGTAVSGQTASIALSISTIVAAGFTSLPQNIQDEKSKPWLASFDDINGNPFTFKVSSGNPDRAIGMITCTLEIYKPKGC